ncbi:MAG: hypothetical protein AB7K71_04760 [Polyangiaceae bacterium]
MPGSAEDLGDRCVHRSRSQRRWLGRALFGLVWGLGVASPHVASAAAPTKPESSEPQYSPWQSKKATPFASLATDVGVVYARPRLTLGYGAPFWNFIGVDAYWLVTNSFTSPYVGWRASLPFLDTFFGIRRTIPFDRRFLRKQEQYSDTDLGLENGGERSSYTAVDFELDLAAPVAHGGAFLGVHPVLIDVPRDTYVYEEVLRVVMRPPFAMGIRGGYVYGFGESQDVQLGALAEYVVVPGRPRGVTRGGPLFHVNFSKHLEGFAAFSFVLDSPDALGVVDGTYAFLGLLHRWAQRF